jgi:uncharacterized membrane protein YfhO
MKKAPLKNTYFLYTVTFLLLLPIIFTPFIIEGKTFVWRLDGINQHYPSLLYYGKLLRGVLSGKGFPMIDFTVGMGFDTITTMQYYVLGDPISLLSVFMTKENSIFFYGFLIILRFYLAGISFIVLMKYAKKDGLGTILGALIYVFCGYSFYAGVRHPFFMNPMIYLPLIILGVEKVLKGKRPYLMIAMVFISAISNFYFFYPITIITVIYVFVRILTLYRMDDKKAFTGFMMGMKIGVYYLLGTALASIIFIPILYAFSQNGRLDVKPGLLSGYFHHALYYYYSLFQGIFAPGIYPGSWTILSFSAVSIVSIAIIFCNKRYRQLQIVYLLTFLGLFVPAFGYFMNGFSYDSNRWCFLVSLLVAISFTFTYDRIYSLEKKEKITLFLVIVSYGIVAYIFNTKQIVKDTFVVLLIIIIMIFLLQMKWFKERKKLGGAILYLFVFFSLGFDGYGFYSKQYDYYTEEFLSKEEVNQSSKGSLVLTKSINDASFYRIETYGDKNSNESLNLGFHDVSGYFSLMDGDVTSYLKDMELLSQNAACQFHSFDSRTIMDSLAGVKYFITKAKESVPYGYKLLKAIDSGSNQYYLYQNTYSLPLGYTYENYILINDYVKLSALEKQNAMLNSVILENNTEYANEANQNTASGIEKLTVKIEPDANITMTENMIKVKKAGATISLTFDSRPNSETYIRLGKLNISLKKSEMANIYVKGDSGALKSVNIRSSYNNAYFGKENYLINLGYSVIENKKAIITFPKKMSFRYDSIEVYSVDMSNYADQINALKKSVLTNIIISDDSIEGDTELGKKGVMVFSIPYSKGWSAYVDGTKEEMLNANVMYLALPLEAGNHHIVLKYRTPYLITGCIVSFIAFIILIGIILYHRRKHSLAPT